MNILKKLSAKMVLSAGAITGYSILGAFCGYVVTSVIFLNCPGILHKKKRRHFYCAHISHRGGAAEKLENTMTAFHHAINVGTQMLELDVNLSKDKKIVVSHDGNLSRCTGLDENISDLNFEDLPLLKNDLNVTFYGSTICHNDGESERFATLEEVFEAFPTTPINLDVKQPSDELMEMTCEMIKRYNRENITVWGNFSNDTTQKLYKLNPEVPLFFSLRRVGLLYLWFYTGLLPFIPLKESHFEIVLPDITKHVTFNISTGRKILLRIFTFIAKSSILVNHLKKRGIPTYFWVLNEEKDFETAFRLGAEGVMTDCPTKLKKWLDDHPHYWVGVRSNDNDNQLYQS